MSDTSSDNDDDINTLAKKFDKKDVEVNYSDNEKLNEKKSVQNSNKNQKNEQVIKESPIKEKKPTKKEETSSDEDSSEERQKQKKEKEKEKEKEKVDEKVKIKEVVKEDNKEKNKKRKKSSSSSDSSSSSSSKEKNKKNKNISKKEENKVDKEKIEREKKEKEEKEKKEKEKKEKEEKEKKEKEEKGEEEREKKLKGEDYSKFKKGIEENNRKKEEESRQINLQNNNRNNNNNFRSSYNNFNNNNYNRNYNDDNNMNYQNSYVRKKAKKYDLNTEVLLRNIISENGGIIDEMRNAYPGIPKLDCANILKRLKMNNTSQTLFEIMNKIHRDISTELTLNRANQSEKKNLFPIDPYEVIDSVYNNPEHVKVMKYFKVYSIEDKKKLPPYLQNSLPNNFYYNKNREKEERRRRLIKYSDGSFNYIPMNCPNIKTCQDINCPYSHNNNENDYHSLFYKTILISSDNSESNKDKKIIKNACDLFGDFRIIYNYKDESIINLMKLIEEKKISKFSYREYMKNKISSFSLNTFKTLECPAIKSGIKCPKGDSHLCYYYHDISERRRPPSLYRYINEMCPDQIIQKGKIKKRCKFGDFCNKCHSRYEYYYHILHYGKAMICKRKKEFGKCQFEETCYAYHPYKEPGYIRTKEEIIQEKKDELLQKYNDENKSLGNLIEKFRCVGCHGYKKKLKYYWLNNCEHVICSGCFKEKKKCPKCSKKFQKGKEGEDFVEIDIANSSKNIDELMKKNYEKKKEEEKKEEDKKDKEEMKETKQKKEKKESDEEEENESDDNKNNANDSMG